MTPPGKLARPWLTVIEDDHSRAIAGYAVNLDAPSALQTALALRQAIWRKSEPGWHVCGIPGAIAMHRAGAPQSVSGLAVHTVSAVHTASASGC